MDYSNTNPVEVVENLSWHDKSPLAFRIFLKRHLNITTFVKKKIRTMIHSEHETYAAPEMELLETGEALCRRKEMGICSCHITIQRQ